MSKDGRIKNRSLLAEGQQRAIVHESLVEFSKYLVEFSKSIVEFSKSFVGFSKSFKFNQLWYPRARAQDNSPKTGFKNRWSQDIYI